MATYPNARILVHGVIRPTALSHIWWLPLTPEHQEFHASVCGLMCCKWGWEPASSHVNSELIASQS